MTYLKAIILGIVQGLTEFLPISSSGHLSVAQYLMGAVGEDVLLMNVLLHLGTLAAVAICFWKDLLALIKEACLFFVDVVKGKYSFRYIKEDFAKMNPNRKMLIFFVISCLPLLFLLLPVGGGEKVMDRLSVFSTDDSILAEGFCFLVTGLMLLSGARQAGSKKPKKEMDGYSAFLVGAAQLFAAAFPGVSRSGATISTGLMNEISEDYMIRYSFILGVPAILAANVSELKSVSVTGTTLSFGHIAVGVIVAAAAGVGAIRLLKWLMKKNYFKYFAYYCFAAGVFCFGTTALSALILKIGG